MNKWFRAVVTTTNGKKFQLSSMDSDDENFRDKVFSFLASIGIEAECIVITEGDWI